MPLGYFMNNHDYIASKQQAGSFKSRRPGLERERFFQDI